MAERRPIRAVLSIIMLAAGILCIGWITLVLVFILGEDIFSFLRTGSVDFTSLADVLERFVPFAAERLMSDWRGVWLILGWFISPILSPISLVVGIQVIAACLDEIRSLKQDHGI